MDSNAVELQSIILSQNLKEEDINFLSELGKKQEVIGRKIKEVEDKKEKVISKISEDKKRLENDPRELREYINNSESVLESIEIVYNNLNTLNNLYRNIKKSFVIISEKCELKLEIYNFEQDINTLVENIDKAKQCEENIKSDNEKNYLIIDSFLNKTLNYDFNAEKVEKVTSSKLENLEDNMVLKIYEKRVELPYTKKEVEEFMKTYPENYKTIEDVVSNEFIVHMSLFNKHPILSRFKEAYYLCRTKEMMPVLDSFNYAKSIMFRSDINSYIIAAVKSKKQLEDYICCLENNKLDEYKHFKIEFNVNPLKV